LAGDAPASPAVHGLAVAPQPSTPPGFAVPRGACNTHVHVIGDLEKFPQSDQRIFTAPPAPVDEIAAMLAAMRCERVVIVNSNVYGTDNACLLDALERLGRERARGVVLNGPETPVSELRALDRAGVRALRVVIRGGDVSARVAATARLVEPLGWHLQVYGSGDAIAALERNFRELPVPVVIDHFGGIAASDGLGQPGFQAMLRLVGEGKAYAKLSGAHRAVGASGSLAALTPFVKALAAANPDRLVWGTDWPHPHATLADAANPKPERLVGFSDIDDGEILNLLPAWAPDSGLREKILVDNPARLFGF
jgi:predicted TIM-barrel fold metal-dependent hydrolase